VRGAGLLFALVLRDPEFSTRVHTALLEAGVLVNLTADRVLRIFPALNIPDADLDAGLSAIERAIREA
jgi:acetylornithine/succinyldiaminopimelate/putrescine aminotransferase